MVESSSRTHYKTQHIPSYERILFYEETKHDLERSIYSLALRAMPYWDGNWFGDEYNRKVRELIFRSMNRNANENNRRFDEKLNKNNQLEEQDILWISTTQKSFNDEKLKEMEFIWDPLKHDSLLVKLGLADYVRNINKENIKIPNCMENHLLGCLLEDLDVNNNIQAESNKENTEEDLFEYQDKDSNNVDKSHSEDMINEIKENFTDLDDDENSNELQLEAFHNSSSKEIFKFERTYSTSFFYSADEIFNSYEIPCIQTHNDSEIILTANEISQYKSITQEWSKKQKGKFKEKLARWLRWTKKQDINKTEQEKQESSESFSTSLDIREISSFETNSIDDVTKNAQFQTKQFIVSPTILLSFGSKSEESSSSKKESSNTNLAFLNLNCSENNSNENLKYEEREDSNNSTFSKELDFSKKETFLLFDDSTKNDIISAEKHMSAVENVQTMSMPIVAYHSSSSKLLFTEKFNCYSEEEKKQTLENKTELINNFLKQDSNKEIKNNKKTLSVLIKNLLYSLPKEEKFKSLESDDKNLDNIK